jgi:hypothetical protein
LIFFRLLAGPLHLQSVKIPVVIRMRDLSEKGMGLSQEIASLSGTIMKGMKMDHNYTDQDWQKLQAHIDQTFGKYLRDSLDLIEHKPRHAVHLLSMSPGDRNDHPQALSAK